MSHGRYARPYAHQHKPVWVAIGSDGCDAIGGLASKEPLVAATLTFRSSDQWSAPLECATMYLSMRRMFVRLTCVGLIQSVSVPPHVWMSSQLTTTKL